MSSGQDQDRKPIRIQGAKKTRPQVIKKRMPALQQSFLYRSKLYIKKSTPQENRTPSQKDYKQIRLQKIVRLLCLDKKGRGSMRTIALISQKGGVGKTTPARQ
jgi:Mrp family chromosome partitioning ATPase